MVEGKTKQDRFTILLRQIETPDDIIEKHFRNGSIERLTVHQGEQKWHFKFTLERPLPVHIYQWFDRRLQEAFRHITQDVSFSLIYHEQSLTEELLVSYWPHVVEKAADVSPAFVPLLKSRTPKLEDDRLYIDTSSETEAGALSKKLTQVLIQHYESLGFKGVSIAFRVRASSEAIEAFKKQREEEIKSKAIEAVQERNKKENAAANPVAPSGPLRYGYEIKDDPIPLKDIIEEERRITTQGYVFDVEFRELRSGRTLALFKITDYTDSILVKVFLRDKEDNEKLAGLKKGMWVKVRGGVQNDTFVRDLVLLGKDIAEVSAYVKEDHAPEGKKRIELHAHTSMSQMDALTPAGALVERAKRYGHEAIAITDHAVAQAYPEAHSAGKKHGVKVLYGVEANLVDDGVPIAFNEQPVALEDATYIVFDVETTGLSAIYHKIIELAAVKVKNGEIIDRFEAFANPHETLGQTTIELTGITDDMVKNAPEIDVVLKQFHEFTGDGILVAHNAQFDMGFLNTGYERMGLPKAANPVIDTLELGRFLYPKMKNHRLNTLCKAFNIELTQHHRAIYDAEATGYLLWKMIKDAIERDITQHDQLNNNMGQGNFERVRPSHCTILARTQEGLKNLYKIISQAHVNYFYRVPRVPRSLISKYREGLLVGSGCSQGEVFEAMMQKSAEEAEKAAMFYDYLEVQPPAIQQHLIEKELVNDELALRQIITNIVQLGKKMNKPVVATGNVHYLDEHEHLYRQILIASQAGNPLNRQTQPPVHFRTTDEMLKDFSFLGEDLAQEVVVDNTHIVANMIDEISPVKDELYTPKIEGAEEEVREMSYKEARRRYGENLPEIVEQRLEKELNSIIGHGFAVIYLISHKLVVKSLSDGYLVGSRGSVGSSFVATMMSITEVNPLPPHYYCPNCYHSEFYTDGSVACGFDLSDKKCPECGQDYVKDGHDIPFETFLGFKGDKVPDIDLNFSGAYQPKAHNYTKELFGEDYVYRAGTIGTVADKTAYGFVKGYEGDHNLHFRSAEIDRLASGCTGVKRTTGQHPGGIIVVPDYMDIYDFTPIQFPADDKDSEWRTTHFDFHSIHDNVLKLDILGHDDPTVIRMLEDLSGIDPKTIPTDDPEVMKIFSSPESLGVTEEQINCKTGTLGIPEFGTRFVRQMLEATRPTTFAELVQLSGLSHGTDVWLNNADELINQGICELKDVIGCRDDIMVYLMHKGLDPSLAFKIMEFVRKGKGLTEEWIEEMKKHDVPDWYVESCQKIKYMFPKAHATAYVLMAVRIAYFKVHHPLLYYATYFSVRADDFDLDIMRRGSSAIRTKIEEINGKGLDASPKEKSLLTVLEIALEMCERGFSFQSIDLYRSSATDFIVDGNSLIPPFNALQGLGTNAAINLAKARDDGEFLSKEDLQRRAKLSKTIVEYLDQHGCLEGLPEANQLSLF
ncbi:DNA polymerase-3 subunit alpha (Gram-positive type) [Pullulanibacillus pueri]|uniref:DNA polymerase III PolC-type n=1 Tax=Pullulanibacillus pueri TaxID=1437324 RepID=A0A8J2ZVR9_9BACL|nr:PolC-type DNA polymerase III [Pullulanibacillus pueri]MBM7682513.1 DNA polymerase-3 subunit alpha (Gram-positive type) [Pullulanibacillus pueri]GGH82099.1 DNA polymerase III PolC-type [Pullulanibacillus pueri]